MEGFIEIDSKYFTDLKDYVRKAENEALELMRRRLKDMGFSTNDIRDPQIINKYQIRKGRKQGDTQIHDVYTMNNILLVEILWEDTKCIIKTPVAEINYAETKRFIKEELDDLLFNLRRFKQEDDGN